jgi:hypothetical protein
VNAVIADRKWETCGAINESVDSFAYDAEYSYDDYYQSDSVKVILPWPKARSFDCHKEEHSKDKTKK